LTALHGGARWRVLLGGIVGLFAFGLLLVAFAALVLGTPEATTSLLRLMVAGVLVSLLGWVIWERVIAPGRQVGGVDRFVRRLDLAGGHRNLLVAAMEADRLPERWSQDEVSRTLSRRLDTRALECLDDVDPVELLGLARWFPTLMVALVIGCLATMPFWLVPGTTQRGLERLGDPWQSDPLIPTAGLYLEEGSASVMARSSHVLAARDFGTPNGAVVCEVRPEFGSWRVLPSRRDSTLIAGPFGRYLAVLDEVTEDFRYRFSRDGMTTGEGLLKVLQPPLLASLDLVVTPPAYTKLAQQTYAPTPSEVQVAHGSHLTWKGRSSEELAAAVMIDAAGDSMRWTVIGDSVQAEMIATREIAWCLHLLDVRGLRGESPIQRTIRIVPDLEPSVRLRALGSDGLFPADGLVPLDLLAEDDYGFSDLRLLVRLSGGWEAPSDSAWTPLRLTDNTTMTAQTPDGDIAVTVDQREGRRDDPLQSIEMRFDGSALEVMPGDVLMIVAEVRDNRSPGPAAVARSRVVRLTLPSAADLLADQVATESDRLEELDEIRQRGLDMREQMAKIGREMKKNADLDFARRQELEDALERQQAIQDELEEMTSDLRQDMNELMKHNATSMELVDRMERVAELLEEVMNEELARLQEQLREAMDRLSEQEIRDAMAEVARNQEEFLDRLDRAIAQLEELRREQEMAELTSSIEEMLRDQQALMDDDQAESPSDAQRQQALADAADELRERLEEALKDLESSDSGKDSPAKEAMEKALEEALERMREEDPAESMRKAAEEMASSEQTPSESPDSPESEQSESGSDTQHEAMRRLASLYHVMMEGQQGMKMAMEQFVAEALRTLAFDLLALSRRQESVAAAIPSDLQDVRAPHLIREQKNVLRGTVALRERLADVLAKSPQMNFQLLQALDRVADQQDEAWGHLQAGWAPQAGQAARQGLGSINSLVVNLLTSAQMSGGGGGGSCPMPSLSQQLEQMAKEQAGLNGMTEMMKRQMGQGQGSMSQEMRAQMDRLQANQQGLAGRMGEAADQEQTAEEAERILGDLGALARDMERVADDLGTGRVGEDTLRRQERILSRMLDARNSVRRRDFSRRRESEGVDQLYRAQQADDLDLQDDDRRNRFRLRRDQVESIPGSYRDLVRRYFRALESLDGTTDTGTGEVRP